MSLDVGFYIHILTNEPTCKYSDPITEAESVPYDILGIKI